MDVDVALSGRLLGEEEGGWAREGWSLKLRFPAFCWFGSEPYSSSRSPRSLVVGFCQASGLIGRGSGAQVPWFGHP